MESMMLIGNALCSQISALSAEVCTTLPRSNAQQRPRPGWVNAVPPGLSGLALAYPQTVPAASPAIADHREWIDEETRQAYMESTVEQDIAWQIAINRKIRKLTQAQLAEACGTKQSSIARAEDPTYGRHSVAMLTRIAHAFDCALRIKLIPYSELAEDVVNTSVEALTVKAFSEEVCLINRVPELQL